MTKIEDIRARLLTKRKALMSEYSSPGLDSDTKDLMRTEGIDPKIREILVLNNINYRTELGVVKNNNINHTLELVNDMLLMLNAIEKEEDQIKTIRTVDNTQSKDIESNRTNILQLNTAQKMMFSVVLVLGVIYCMVLLSPSAVHTSVTVIKSLFGGYLPPPQEVQQKQQKEYLEESDTKDNAFLKQVKERSE